MASLQNGSAKQIDPLCDPCRYEGSEETAESFCQDCLEYLCPVCCHFHRKFSATRAHSIIHQRELAQQTTIPKDPRPTRQGLTYEVDKEQRSLSRSMQTKRLHPNGRFSGILADDMTAPQITGCTYLHSNILLVDQANRKVKLFDSNLSNIQQLKLEGTPADVTTVRPNMAAVTVPNKYNILLVKTSPNLSIYKTIATLRRCWGIDFNNEELYVSCGESEDTLIYIYNLLGEVLTFIQPTSYLFSRPQYLSVSPTGGTIYITDTKDAVIAMGMDGRIIFEFSNPDCTGLCGITCDARAIYIACDLALICLDTAGTSYTKLLRDCDQLQCVCKNLDQDKFLVAEKNTPEIAIFSK